MSTDAAEGPDGLGPIPERLPLLPIRDLVVFPYMVVPLYVSREISLRAVEGAAEHAGLVFLCAQKSASADVPAEADLYRVGTVGKLLKTRQLPDGQVKVLVQGLRRARVDEFTFENHPSIHVRLSVLDDIALDRNHPELISRVRALKDGFAALSAAGRSFPEEVMTVLMGLDDPSALADLVAANLGLKVEDAQAVLEAADLTQRLSTVHDCLRKEVEVLELKKQIQTQAKEEMSRTQREYFLREQLKQIRQELGEFDSKEEDLDDLRRRLTEAGLPPEPAREAERQLRRLEQMNGESSEAALVRTYLDWLADVPWQKQSLGEIDLGQARAILDEDHYGLDKIKERILEFLGVIKLVGDHAGPVLCFVGPPGTGKTSLGRSIAKALGRQFVRIALGGVRDEAEIRGHRKTYVGAMPGRIVHALKQADARNPLILLDEIDKMGSDNRGDPAAALLEVLDPEQNRSFRDHYLNLPLDLSKVVWVATANLVDSIPAALRDRMEVIPVPGYHLGEKVEIMKRHLIPRLVAASGLRSEDLSFGKKAMERVVESYTLEAGVRELDRQLAAIARKVARKFAEGDRRPVTISDSSLERYLGAPRSNDRGEVDDTIGVATGLAWTEAGGALLQIEVTSMVGRPQLTLTGQLGKVMKESAQAALSLARSRPDLVAVRPEVFAEQEFHVHVPQGAIPKDGPSAGVTIAAALISLLGGYSIKKTVAMTGEITLRGRVLPVGGIREKVLAAARAGMTDVIVPAANEPDLVDIPPAVKKKLNIHLARRIEDALEVALVGFVRPRQRRTSFPPPSPDAAIPLARPGPRAIGDPDLVVPPLEASED